jgi:hypothetical protein
MNTIKTTKKKSILLNNQEYVGFTVGNLPNKFAYIYSEEKENDGLCEWFNYKGLTWLLKDDVYPAKWGGSRSAADIQVEQDEIDALYELTIRN